MWLPKTPTHTVPKMISSAAFTRERVSVSPSVHGAIAMFHTTTMPAIGAMIDCAAKPYAVMSNAGSITAVHKSPSG